MSHEKIIGRPMEVLLVEDDLEDAGITIDALKSGEVPCRISLVRDGEESLEFLFKQGRYRRVPKPDVILLDMNLPKKDGREVLAVVRGDETLKSIPVVVLTSSPANQAILERENLHVEGFLNKPVESERFLKIVKSLRKYMLSDVILPL